MDPNLSNPNDPAVPTANVVVPEPVSQVALPAEPVIPPAPQISPTAQVYSQEPQVQTQPLIQDTSPHSPVANPISQNEPPAPPADTNFEGVPKKHRISKKIAAVVLVLFLAVSIPLTVFVANQQQNTKSGAAPSILNSDPVVAVFNGQNIHAQDLAPVAQEQYDPSAIDNADVLKSALNISIERKILDLEQTQKNIQVTQDEIDQKVSQDGVSQKQAKYEVLQNKVTILETKNWQAYTVGFWVPPTDEQNVVAQNEVQTRQNQLSDGLKALSDVEVSMQTDKAPLDIAKEEIAKYPSLAQILGVNAYLIASIQNGADLTNYITPATYTYDSANVGNPFYDTLYAMKTPQVQKVLATNNGGGSVIKLIKANPNAQFNSYSDWLNNKKALLFTDDHIL